MKIFVFRHANRKDRASDKTERDAWFNSKRYKENPWDMPLSELGKQNTHAMANNLMKQIDVTELRYFTVSPIARCMETAIHMIDYIFNTTKHRIKIRVEYGITEPLVSIDMTYFEKNTIKGVQANYVERNGIKYKTKIDKKLYPKELKKKYSKYLDTDFESVQNYKDMGATSRNNNIKRSLKAFRRLTKNTQVVITHASIAFWFHMSTTQQKPNPSKDLFAECFGGKHSVGIMTGYEFTKNKPAKVIYKTTNCGVIIEPTTDKS